MAGLLRILFYLQGLIVLNRYGIFHSEISCVIRGRYCNYWLILENCEINYIYNRQINNGKEYMTENK